MEKILQTVFEMLPITLAIIAIVTQGKKFKSLERNDKIISFLGICCSIMLIIAQSSWYVTAVIMENLKDTVLINDIWTLFNIGCMTFIILVSLKKIKR